MSTTSATLPEGVIHNDGRIDLPQPLTQAQVRSFVDDGFWVMPKLIDCDAIEELKRDTLAIARGRQYPCDNIKPIDEAVADGEVLKRFLCIHQPHYISSVMQKYVQHPAICGILSQITAAHLAHWDGSVKCMQSMLFVKPPGFQGQAWHQDEIYIPTRDRSLIGAWIAIDDATIDNGCLWVVPGSHRSGYLYPQRDHHNPQEFDASQESFGFEDNDQIPVEVPAGSVVFFNGHLLHRSQRNRSEIYRRVLVNHYMNTWSQLPWYNANSEPKTSVAQADDRRIIPVAGIDPYAWRGVRKPLENVSIRQCDASGQ